MVKPLVKTISDKQIHPAGSPNGMLQAKESLPEIDDSDTEAAFIQALQRKIPGSFETLIRRHRSQILRVAFRITQNHEDAEDAVQETFLKVYSHIEGFRGDSKLMSWITRIAINQSLMQRRRRKSTVVSIDEAVQNEKGPTSFDISDVRHNPLETVLLREIDAWCSESINRLPNSSRGIAELYFLLDRTIREIAQTTSLSVPAIKSHIHRARKTLRGSNRTAPVPTAFLRVRELRVGKHHA